MTPEEIRSIRLFWSLRRRRYWNMCRLKYFLHYYAAVLGRREFPDPLYAEARELDRCISSLSLTRIMICNALHDLFERGSCRSVAQEAEECFRKAVWRMQKYPDSVRYIVPEILRGDGGTVERLADGIRRAGEKVDETFWHTIQKIPSASRRRVERPQIVHFLELACYFVPVLTFSHSGEIWILESSAVNEDGDLLSCLHRMWVANALGRDPTRVRSLYLDENYDLKQLADLPSASAALAGIKKDLDAMLEAEMLGCVTVRDFPPSPGKGCQSCQFRSYCLKNGHIGS